MSFYNSSDTSYNLEPIYLGVNSSVVTSGYPTNTQCGGNTNEYRMKKNRKKNTRKRNTRNRNTRNRNTRKRNTRKRNTRNKNTRKRNKNIRKRNKNIRKKNKNISQRNTRKRNGGSSAEQMDEMDEMEIWKVPMVVALESFKPEDDQSERKLIKGRPYNILGKQERELQVKVKDTRWREFVGHVPMNFLKFVKSKESQESQEVEANNDWSASGQIIPDNRFFTYSNAIDITKGSRYIIFPELEISGPEGSEGIYNYGGPQGETLDKFGYFPKRFVEIPP